MSWILVHILVLGPGNTLETNLEVYNSDKACMEMMARQPHPSSFFCQRSDARAKWVGPPKAEGK